MDHDQNSIFHYKYYAAICCEDLLAALPPLPASMSLPLFSKESMSNFDAVSKFVMNSLSISDEEFTSTDSLRLLLMIFC